MIKIDNLSLSFGEKTLYKNLTLEIQDNKITVITGLNGVGKTTLMKILSKITEIKDLKITSNVKENFYIPQHVNYPSGVTLFEYITSVFYKNSFKWFLSKAEKESAKKVLEELDLQDRLYVDINKLSSGELQKANIAMAIISEADCIFLDEPTANLDIINQIKILDLIKSLKDRNKTIIMVTHDLNQAANYGDYFVGINRNDVLQGDKETFFTEKNLEKIFGIKFEVIKDEKIYYIKSII